MDGRHAVTWSIRWRRRAFEFQGRGRRLAGDFRVWLKSGAPCYCLHTAVPTITNFIATNGLPGKDETDKDDHSWSSLYWQQHVDQKSDKREAEAVERKVRQRSTRGTTGDSRHKFASDPRQRKTFENVLLQTRWLEFRTSDAIPSTLRAIKVYFNSVDLRSYWRWLCETQLKTADTE